MNNNKLLPISIIIAAVIISIPLGKIANTLEAPSKDIDLPDVTSIKEQITGNDESCTFIGCRYSIDKTKLMASVSFTEGDSFFPNCTIIYEMDEFGRFLKKSNIVNVKRRFPQEIK
jgi:hypothetical protein